MSGISRFVGKAGERDNLKDVDIWLVTGKNGVCECCGEATIRIWCEGMWMCPLCLIENINEEYNVGLHIN